VAWFTLVVNGKLDGRARITLVPSRTHFYRPFHWLHLLPLAPLWPNWACVPILPRWATKHPDCHLQFIFRNDAQGSFRWRRGTETGGDWRLLTDTDLDCSKYPSICYLSISVLVRSTVRLTGLPRCSGHGMNGHAHEQRSSRLKGREMMMITHYFQLS
jgi:hypothetical protein